MLWPLRFNCIHGDLAGARRIASEPPGLGTADARECYGPYSNLAWACGKGHLAFAQWLVAHFSLTAADARANDNHALRAACSGGHLEVAQWLVSRFGLTAADARVNNAIALIVACCAGRYDMAKWLVMHFNFSAADVRCSLLAARGSGRSEIERWLKTVGR